MQIDVKICVCFLIALCSAMKLYKWVVFKILLSLILMDCASNLNLYLTKCNDFGCGFFFIFGCISKNFNVFVAFLLFLLGFVLLQYSGHCRIRGKSTKGLALICSCNDDDIDGVKFEKINETESLTCEFCNDVDINEGESEELMECCDEDQVFDVITLRKMVKIQRKKANAAQNELEKERMAAASLVDEAMTMILRLQNEKSVLKIKANQLDRASEDKRLHDQEVVQSLQWIIRKHESERSILEDQLRMCRGKMKMFIEGDEWNRFNDDCPSPSVSHSSFEKKVDS